MNDILLYENGNGGELSVVNGDIETTDSLANQMYLSHFGGNIEADTTGQEIEGEERFDWWGNEFLDTENQMNSSLERVLNKTSLNSAGRIIIENTAKKDLEFFGDMAKTDCQVSITGNNKLIISDKINQNKINFQWDATKEELIVEKII